MYIHLTKDDVELASEATPTGRYVQLDAEMFTMPATVENGNATTQGAQFVTALLSRIYTEEQLQGSGRYVEASVFPVDPWLLALAELMSDGIVQGMTWDVCKVVLLKALAKMQSLGVAPKAVGDRKTERDLRISWSGYLEFGQLFKLFCKMELKYKHSQSQSPEEKTPDAR